MRIANTIRYDEVERNAPTSEVLRIRSSVGTRLLYLARVLRVYAHRRSGPLSFWYEKPEVNERAFGGDEYFMTFAGKARYKGPFDAAGIPLLDYQGDIGRQHNPIAIAQYGLARFNRWCGDADAGDDRAAWTGVADWLARELRPNGHGVPVWMHDFDWPYRQLLRVPLVFGPGTGQRRVAARSRREGDGRGRVTRTRRTRLSSRFFALSRTVACW